MGKNAKSRDPDLSENCDGGSLISELVRPAPHRADRGDYVCPLLLLEVAGVIFQEDRFPSSPLPRLHNCFPMKIRWFLFIAVLPCFVVSGKAQEKVVDSIGDLDPEMSIGRTVEDGVTWYDPSEQNIEGRILPPRDAHHTANHRALQAAYKTLIDEGVTGLHYIAGDELYGTDGDGATDGSHASDLGFMRQANVFDPVLRKAMGIQ